MQKGVVKGMWPEVLMEQHLNFIICAKKAFQNGKKGIIHF